MTFWIWFGIIAVVVGFVFLLLRNKRVGVFAPGGTLGSDPSIFDIRIIHQDKGTTPKGMRVLSYHDPSASSRELADAGMSRTFEIAENVYNYRGFPRHAGFNAGFLPRSNKCEAAAFLIEQTVEPGTNYDGSIYDKDPRPGKVQLCVAGMFQFVDNRPTVFVVDDAGMTENAAAYEAEHAVLAYADPDKFAATQYHQNGGHPILPDTRRESIAAERILGKHEFAEFTLSNGDRVCALLTK